VLIALRVPPRPHPAQPLSGLRFRRCQLFERPPRRILFRKFLAAAQAARQRFSRLICVRLQPHFHQKTLLVVGPAFALYPVNRCPGPRRL